MRLFFKYSRLTLVIFLFINLKIQAQSIKDQADLISESINIKPINLKELFKFPNINSGKYYINTKKINKIKKLLKENNQEEAYPLLVQYISQFGIYNFKNNINLVWELAKISKKAGFKNQYQELILLTYKHNKSNDNTIRQITDTLNQKSISEFLPEEEYYALAEAAEYLDNLKLPMGLKENMGFYVNSSSSDYAPSINQSNESIIFTSQRYKKEGRFNPIANEELMFSQKEGDSWGKASILKGVNTIINEGSACINKENNILYFSRCGGPEGFGNCDIYTARFQEDGTWGDIKNLGANINSTNWDSHPNISDSGDTLFFASSRSGGFGNSDLYYATRNQNGRWTKAKNLGAIINTKQNDVSPFYDGEKNILYFSSNGHITNFGEYDIYKSRQVLKNSWESPKNVGPLVNGKYSEFYFTIDQNFEKLYYAKSIEQDLQNLDIYSYRIPMGAHPDAYTSFSGSLTETESKRPLDGIVAIIDLDEGTEIAPKLLEKDGSFNFELINERNYLMVIHGDEYFRIEKMFYLNGDMEMHESTVPISRKIKFESIEFENGKSDLQPSMYSDLGKVARFLQDHPKFKLLISGHTDGAGDPAFNLKLSQKRADAIKDYLVHFANIPSPRVVSMGHGSKKPIIAVEKTKEDRKINRRVEFEIYQPNKEELQKMEAEMDKMDSLNDW